MADALAPFRLDGRVAIVTGSSRGIGRALAVGLAEVGASVVVTGRRVEATADTVSEIEAAGGTALGVDYQAGDEASIGELVGLAADRFGAIDILVNNAAILKPHRLEKVSAAELEEIHRVNVMGPVLLAKEAAGHLGSKRRGAVVMLGAVAAHRPMEGIGAYAASKASLLHWTRVMAREWAGRIRVNALTPGPVATDMILPRDPARRDAFEREMANETLVGRIATPADLVPAALFLASDASSFMTGQTLVVDGGMLA